MALSQRSAAAGFGAPPASAQLPRQPLIERTEQLIGAALGGRSDALFVREPLIDPVYPATSDADVLAFADVDELVPERLNLPAAPGTLPIDVIWLPRGLLSDPQAMARQGLMLHRLATARPLCDAEGVARKLQADIAAATYRPEARAARIDGFFDMGFLTVREIGVTRDMPAVALFWLHMTMAAALAAAAEALDLFCPNVYTRPLDSLRAIEAGTGWRWRDRLVRALRLDGDIAAAIGDLRRLHDIVIPRYPAPQWPATMRASTRAEYVYFGNREELSWRIAVAHEMAAAGDAPAALHYLRFWGYSLARMPMVHESAAEGRSVSFMRPERAVGPALRRLCPELVEPLHDLLADGSTGRDTVDAALAVARDLRQDVVTLLRDRGIVHAEPKPWIPHGEDAGVP